MTYQAAWLKGVEMQGGDRACEHRYEIIRRFCQQFHRPFTVLDIGANLAYFSLRLTEDFGCTAVAIEGSQSGDACLDLLRLNENPGVILLKRDITLDELRQIAEVEHFDMVLALSVIHHFPGSFEERLEVFRSLGDHLILELANEDEAGGGEQKAYMLPDDAQLIGYGESHLVPGAQREMALISRPKTRITKHFLGSERTDLDLLITSDFDSKRVRFFHKLEERQWYRGINLVTYLEMCGVWPTRDQIVAHLYALELEGRHWDICPWNVILQGDAVRLIDRKDENMTVQVDDAEGMAHVIHGLRMEESDAETTVGHPKET